jgi:membrane dipeptidase
MKQVKTSASRFPVCDLHCDTAGLWLAGSHLNDTSLQVNLPYMLEAGVGMQVFACYIPPSIPPGRRMDGVMQLIDAFNKEISRYPGQIVHCRNSKEVAVAQARGQIAAVLAVENGNAIEADLKNLERLYAAGVRLLTIVHARSNEWCISSNDKDPAFDGLTPFGLDVIRTMNRLGMIIDVSHSHDLAVAQVLKHSRQPIVASHSNAWALCRVPRNLKNELAAELAAGGGLLGINFFPGFLDSNYSRNLEAQAGDLFAELSKAEAEAGNDLAEIARLFPAFSDRLRRAMQQQTVPVERIIDHIQYLVDLLGIEHVAFGSDFDGIPDTPVGVEDCRGFQVILNELAQRGFSDLEREAISWSNFQRVFRTVCG